jgi:hypothetical protein
MLGKHKLINFVVKQVLKTIELFPEKTGVANFLIDLRNKSPDEFLSFKNYSLFLEINCRYFFDEKSLSSQEIDKEILREIVSKLKQIHK